MHYAGLIGGGFGRPFICLRFIFVRWFAERAAVCKGENQCLRG
jgi:hypothetical protein